ncbi:MAG TPA: DMT family transporter [Burkholderiales bacterium]|nr:DMT family transporter [Burkholderiales bacterium]
MTRMRSDIKQGGLPVLALLMSATLWGMIWYPYRWLSHTGVSGLMSTFMTYGIALIAGLPFYRRHLNNVRTAKGWWLAIVVASGWTNTAYVLAVIHGEVMRVSLLFYLAPLWTILFSRVLLAERLSRTGYYIVLLSLGGAVVMLWRPDGRFPVPGNAAEWAGLSAGISFALTNVISKKAGMLSIEAKSVGIWIGGAVMPLPLLMLQPGAFGAWGMYSAMTWGVLLTLAAAMLIITVVLQYGLLHVAANRAIVILLFELIVSALSAYFLAGESLVGKEWLGAAMIMIASLFSGRLDKEAGV